MTACLHHVYADVNGNIALLIGIQSPILALVIALICEAVGED